jgi:hypothetical protein
VSRIDPVPPADAVRARVPAALAAYAETRATVLESGIVDRALKELCGRYLAEDDEVLAHADDPERFDERERAALAWTHAIAWNSDAADEALWARASPSRSSSSSATRSRSCSASATGSARSG